MTDLSLRGVELCRAYYVDVLLRSYSFIFFVTLMRLSFVVLKWILLSLSLVSGKKKKKKRVSLTS